MPAPARPCTPLPALALPSSSPCQHRRHCLCAAARRPTGTMTRTVPDVGKSSLCLRPCVILCHSVCPDRTPALTPPPPLSPRGRFPPQLPHSRSASPFRFPLPSFPLDHSLLSHIFLRPYPITISCFISLSYFSHSLSRFLPFLFLPFSFPFPPFLISSLLFPRFLPFLFLPFSFPFPPFPIPPSLFPVSSLPPASQ